MLNFDTKKDKTIFATPKCNKENDKHIESFSKSIFKTMLNSQESNDHTDCWDKEVDAISALSMFSSNESVSVSVSLEDEEENKS